MGKEVEIGRVRVVVRERDCEFLYRDQVISNTTLNNLDSPKRLSTDSIDSIDLGINIIDKYTIHPTERPRANIFLILTTRCNASCKFCDFSSGDHSEFNTLKLRYILDSLIPNININKLNITGGEPTLDLNLFNEVMEIIKEYKEKYKGLFTPYVTVNTNGYNIKELFTKIDEIDSIALSRHHFNDEINGEVFGNTKNIPSSDTIRELMKTIKPEDVYKINLRCNLISGYIDTPEKIKEYLEWVSSLNIHWVGLVTLMPLNKYCLDRAVLEGDIVNIFDGDSDYVETESWVRKEPIVGPNQQIRMEAVCKCKDYIYTSESGSMIKIYTREFNHCDLTDGQLVYNGKNLYQGFRFDNTSRIW